MLAQRVERHTQPDPAARIARRLVGRRAVLDDRQIGLPELHSDAAQPQPRVDAEAVDRDGVAIGFGRVLELAGAGQGVAERHVKRRVAGLAFRQSAVELGGIGEVAGLAGAVGKPHLDAALLVQDGRRRGVRRDGPGIGPDAS